MRHVTLVNRTSKNLVGTWDGRQYTIEPGKHSFPAPLAEKFKAQNPIMGSLDPRTGERQSLLGIVEQHDDISPIEQNTEAVELWDRSKMGEALQNVEVVAGKTGLFSAKDLHQEAPKTNSTFVNP
jgi:hypothetical protein